MTDPPPTILDYLPLQTARLELRRLTFDDAAPLAAMLADPQVMRYFPSPMSRRESDAWLCRNLERYDREGTGLFAVCLAGTWIGDCGLVLRRPDTTTALELGYHFKRTAWGQGFATEAARACVALARTAAPSLTLVALVRPGNEPSRRVVSRLGFQPRGAMLHAGMVHERWIPRPTGGHPAAP